MDMNAKIMTVGIDIDCVLSQTDVKLDKLGFKRESDDAYAYIGLEGFFLENPDFYRDLEIVPGSVEAVNRLSENHNIIFISHRDDNAYDVTKEWFRANGFPDRPIYFTKDKGKLGKELGLDLALDDSPYCAISYKEAGIECWLLPKPYNRALEGFKRFYWESLSI